MMALKAFFFGSLATLCYSASPSGAAKHPFHVSSTEITYQNNNKHLEIISKFFVDDFEQALKRELNPKLKLENNSQNSANAYIEAYMKRHLRLFSAQKPIAFRVIGYEIERESCLVYLETGAVVLPKKLDISCDFLYSSFNDQMNIFHLNLGAKKESFKLNYPNNKLQ